MIFEYWENAQKHVNLLFSPSLNKKKKNTHKNVLTFGSNVFNHSSLLWFMFIYGMKFVVYIDINGNVKDENKIEELLKGYRCKYNVKNTDSMKINLKDQSKK